MRRLLVATSAIALGLWMTAPMALADKGGVPNSHASSNAVGNTGQNNGNGSSISSANGRIDNGYGNGGEPYDGTTTEAADGLDQGNADAYRPCKVQRWC